MLIGDIKNESDINQDRRSIENLRLMIQSDKLSPEQKARLEELFKKRQEKLNNRFNEL